MTKRDKIILGIIGAVLGVMLGAMLMPAVKKLAAQAGSYLLDVLTTYQGLTYADPVYYELTDEEKEWLCAGYSDTSYAAERINEGRLLSGEVERLKMAREGLAVLEEKYPGYHFWIRWSERYNEFTSFTIYEENTGKSVAMSVEGDDESGYEVADDFLGYALEDKLTAYIEEQLEKEGIEGVSVRPGGFWTSGKEYNINLSAEDIVGGRLKTWVDLSVYIYVGDMSEEGCMEYAQTIEQIMNKIGLYGFCDLYFKDTTKEEMLVTGEKGETVYNYYFQSK